MRHKDRTASFKRIYTSEEQWVCSGAQANCCIVLEQAIEQAIVEEQKASNLF
jgi:hypothetical protein